MLYLKETSLTFEQVCSALEKAVEANKFGVLGVHNLKEKMEAKGVSFERECRVFEVCNPMQAKKVLEANMAISNALPCRICVYEDAGKVVVSTIKPTMLLGLFGNPELQPVAQDVEATLIRIIDSACA
jgi:uncharacterized protein (DUF302 family)